MAWRTITGNGDIDINVHNGQQTSGYTVLAPASMNGASIIMGYLDNTDTFVALIDGAITDAGQTYIKSASGLKLIAQVSGYTADFDINVLPGA